MKKFLLCLGCVFTLIQVNSQSLVNEDFNDGFPSDWSISTLASDGGWNVGTAATNGSQFWDIADPADGTTFIATNDDNCNCDKSEDRLILPTIDLSAISDKIFLTYDIVFAGGEYQGAAESLNLEVSYDEGATWELLSTVDGDGTIAWRSAFTDLTSLGGNASVTLSFVYNDDGGWVFGAGLDNVLIEVPNKNDVALVFNPNAYRFADISTGYDVSGILTNFGSDTLNSVDINISEGANSYSETITDLGLAPFESSTFTLNIPISEATGFNLDVVATNPNSATDEDDTNNSDSFEGIGVENAPSKMIFVEESTGTWCPWCPRGAVFMDRMEEEIEEHFAGVAVHVGQSTWPDPMQIAGDYPLEYAGLVSGFPTLVIDRDLNPGIPGIDDMTEFGRQLVELAESRPSPIGLSVSAEIDKWTREMSIDLTATAHSNMDADFTIMLLITEDHVTGDGFDYRQANNYAAGAQGPMDGWEALANPASGNDIEFSHTLREAIGGFTGLTGIIPATISSGETYTYEHTYTIPDTYDMEELNIVAVVLDQGNEGVGYNSHIDRNIEFLITAVEEISSLNELNAYPNPTGDNLTVEVAFDEVIDFRLEVIDVLGNKIRTLTSQNTQNFKSTYDVSDLPKGIYSLAIMTKDGQNVTKFVKM